MWPFNRSNVSKVVVEVHVPALSELVAYLKSSDETERQLAEAAKRLTEATNRLAVSETALQAKTQENT